MAQPDMSQHTHETMRNLDQTDYWASPTTQAFAFIGLLWLSVKIFSFWRMIASLFLLPGVSLSKFGKPGSWALVTGASDGIGREYALQLAAKGFNVLLVSRTQSKLDELASDIESRYKVQTKTLAMDFAANNDKDYNKLKDLIQSVDSHGDAGIALLINNVGLSHSIPVSFADTPESEMRDIITVNCTATLRVTHLVVPGMLKRKNGLVLSMASFGGVLPTPLLATYSGSKAFLQHWSSALASELAPHGIRVQLVQSYLVTSAMSKIRRSSLLVPTPRTFVRAALAKVGRQGGAQGIHATSTPYWAHAIMQWGISTFAGTMGGWTIDLNRKMHEDIRARALRKAERDKKKSS